MNRYIKIILSLFMVLSFAACNSDLLYEENLKVSDAKWLRSERAIFKFAVEDTSAFYDIYLNFRHGGDYPFKNLYLFVKTKNPNGLYAKDTAQMIFADNKGRWLGKGIGGIYDYQFKFKEGISFPKSGEYEVELEQGMREIELDDVTDVGIRIEKVSE